MQLFWACGAIDEDQAEVAQLLDEGANTEYRNQGGGRRTPIIQAACCGNLAIVRLLADRGADINARTDEGRNALIWAIIEGHVETAAFLLDRGVDIHARDNLDRDVLLWAALMGKIDTCIMLIGRQADARMKNCKNLSALTHFGTISGLNHEKKQHGQARLIAAWLAGPHPSQVVERNWQRRKNAVLFLVGSKFRLTVAEKAAAKIEQEQLDKHVKLPGVPRRSKEENLAYLHKEVFGHEGIQRNLVGML